MKNSESLKHELIETHDSLCIISYCETCQKMIKTGEKNVQHPMVTSAMVGPTEIFHRFGTKPSIIELKTHEAIRSLIFEGEQLDRA